MANPDELLHYLFQPALARLWGAVRRKLEQLGRVGGEVRISAATPEERQAVAGLLGLPTLPAEALSVRLDRLDAALRSSRFAVDLPAAMARLGGPLRDLPAERRQKGERGRQLWELARSHPLLAKEPALGRWLSALAKSGLLRRLAPLDDEAKLLVQAFSVLETLLPRDSEREARRLALLANQVLQRSHGLDAGQPAATITLSALAFLKGAPHPKTSAERRKLWEWAGVVADDLSCDVLTLGLSLNGGGHVGTALRALVEAGEPARLTLRQLAALESAAWPAGRVRVCENPIVLASAADHLGAASPPLVCAAGVPNQAVRVLLAQLARAGAELAYHGDFDWAGVRIANGLFQAFPLQPWRFTAPDYGDALARASESCPLSGEAVPALWDDHLAAAMVKGGVAVEEEAVVEKLMGDLEA